MDYVYRRCVQFADTDAAGVVHFARLLCYVEEAEHACLVELGIPLLGDVGWPRVDVQCSYHTPLKMGDVVEVAMEVLKLGATSIVWKFSMVNGESRVAEGKIKTVCVGRDGKPVPLSEAWRSLLLG